MWEWLSQHKSGIRREPAHVGMLLRDCPDSMGHGDRAWMVAVGTDVSRV